MPIPGISIGIGIGPVLDKVSVSELGPKILVSPTPGMTLIQQSRVIGSGLGWLQKVSGDSPPGPSSGGSFQSSY